MSKKYLKYWNGHVSADNFKKLCNEQCEKLIEVILYSNLLSTDSKINIIMIIIESNVSKSIDMKPENAITISNYIEDIIDLHKNQKGFIDYIVLNYKKINANCDEDLTLNRTMDSINQTHNEKNKSDEITLNTID